MLLLVLLIAFVNGIIYVRLIPPWQHYDEPGHVEYARLIAERLRIPRQGDYDQSMRRELAASMVEHDFFKGLDFRPNFLSLNEPVWIGHPQVSGLPLYYILVALPLRLVRYSDITFQLYLGRTISILLYLITIITAYGIVREITPNNHPLRWMVPISLALLPGFVDIMAAVNDDVGATAAFSLFLWAGVRVILRGFSWLRATALVITALACSLTKNTVVVASILLVLPLLLRISRNIPQRYLWVGISALGLLLMFTLFRRGDAAYWHRATTQRFNTSTPRVDAPIGKEAFQLNSAKGIFQLVPQSSISELRGKTITLGAWVWADQPTHSQTPTLKFNGQEINQDIILGRKPVFYAFSTVLPEDISQLLVTVTPGVEPEHGGRVYYDGIVLVKGNYSEAGIPSARNIDASKLDWNNNIVKNFIRNPSAEKTWLVIRPTINRLLDYYIPDRPDLYISLLQDWRSATWYYKLTFENLLQTFWGKFGWGHVPIIIPFFYPVLALISLLGIIGAIISILRQWHDLPLSAYIFLFISGSFIWFFTLLRGLNSIMEILFIPSSRYAFPAIIPTVLALNMGWLELGYWIRNKINARMQALIFLVFFLSLDAIAIFSIIKYFYSGV